MASTTLLAATGSASANATRKPLFTALTLRRSDIADVGDQVLDVPVGVVEELVERQRYPSLDAFDVLRSAIALEVVPLLRARHVRAVGLGFQEHIGRHVTAPRIHRAADDDMVDAPLAQMRRNRQAVRASTDN